MKILYISGDIGVEVGGRKGASTHVRETCHALKRYGHEVLIVTPNPGDLSQVEVDVRRIEAPTARWLGSDSRYMILNHRMKGVLEEINRTFRPDAVYERYSLYQTAGIRFCRRHNLPRILEVNTLLAREQANRLHFPGFAMKIEKSLWRRERAVICVSEVLKGIMIEEANMEPEKMLGFRISPVAVDVNRFNPSVSPDPRVAELAQGRIVAGYVGTLTAWHGVDLFFDVAALLKKAGLPILVLSIGGEPERIVRLRQRTRDLDLESHLHFYGSISHNEVPGFLAAMQMCLIADTQDWSSPTKFFEFAAMEKPIIASESPSVHEVFGKGEQSGLFFQRGNAQGMVEQIEKLVRNPELGERIAKAARKRVLSSYTWACNVKTIMELYALQGLDAPQIPANVCSTPT